MRARSGLTKTMFLRTSGSFEFMSESASTSVSGLPVRIGTETAGTTRTSTPARPVAEDRNQEARLLGLDARCRTTKPAIESPIRANPIGWMASTAHTTNAQHQHDR